MIPIVVILGPTAVGKSSMAVRLATDLNGEIVNADSMQVYKHLRIGTAAPSPGMLKACPHHLFYVLDLDKRPDAAWYARHAAKAIEEVHARGNIPIVTGGTFFWVKTLLEGIAQVPDVPGLDPSQFENPHAKLQEVDPALAARLHPSDLQRIMRGLEVYYATQRPLSEFQAQSNESFGEFRPLRIWLDMDREMLYQRINLRLDEMVKEGLVDEVKTLLNQGVTPDIPAFRYGGYKYVVDHCQGRISMDEMKEKTAQEHRNYARRQMIWLRRELREGKLVKLPAQDYHALKQAVTGFGV